MTRVSADPTPRTPAADRPGVLVRVPLRWSDMDAYGHVNNTEYLRLMEQARFAGATIPQGGPAGAHLVARHEIEYTAQLEYRGDGVLVRLWCPRVGAADWDYAYEISSAEGTVHAVAQSLMVAYDLAAARPRRLTTQERAQLTALTGPPPVFRRR